MDSALVYVLVYRHRLVELHALLAAQRSVAEALYLTSYDILILVAYAILILVYLTSYDILILVANALHRPKDLEGVYDCLCSLIAFA